MLAAAGDRPERLTALNQHRNVARDEISIAELAGVIRAPTIRAGLQESAGVRQSGRHADERVAISYSGRVGAERQRGVAQLTCGIPAPAEHPAADARGTSVS